MHSRGLLRSCSRHECPRRTLCDARCSSQLRYTVEDLHSGEATNSRSQSIEEKALSLISRSPSRRSNRPVGIRETPLLQPISSGPTRLAIHTGSQCACLEFVDLTRDRLLLANRGSRSGSNLLSLRRPKRCSKEKRQSPE